MYIVLAFVIGVSMNAVATIWLKIGSADFPTSFSFASLKTFFTNLYLWGGLLLYALSFPPYLYIFKNLKVSIAYPTFVSLGFAATIIIAFIFLKESLTILQICGLVLVVGGIILLATNSA